MSGVIKFSLIQSFTYLNLVSKRVDPALLVSVFGEISTVSHYLTSRKKP